jgi:hypothetical protein
MSGHRRQGIDSTAFDLLTKPKIVNCTSLALLTREPSVNFLDLFNTVSYLLIKQKSLHGRYFKELEQPEVNIQASHA